MGDPKKYAKPLKSLLPYGRKWIDEPARFKIGMWARQTGKSYNATLEAVLDCRLHKTTWVILSAGERQSLETMHKAREHDKVFGLAGAGYDEIRTGGRETLLKQAELRWPNGSRLIGIPANPNTARGYSANLLLDEFAFHEDPDAIWRAIYPSISNPLRGTYKIRVVSTPNGRTNKFHDLWTKENTWSKHRVDIYEAVKQGLPLNIEELKAGLDDPEGWAQEYECQFIDDSSVLLPYELITAGEHPGATTSIDPGYWAREAGGPPVVCGIDFGRKRDLTVCWTLELTGGGYGLTREVLELKGVPTPEQLEILRPRLQRARRVCVDYTGPGIGLGDLLVARQEGWGEYNPKEHKFGKIELCAFTNTLKLELFPALRVAFEKRLVGVPSDRNVREDLHSLCRVALAAGGVTYRAPHTDSGHADRATALALALRAGNTGGGPVAFGRVAQQKPTAGSIGMGRVRAEVAL